MSKFFTSILFFFLFITYSNATNFIVNTGSFYFTPSNLQINVGDTVTWINDGGTHNVNFDSSSISGNSFNNPESFISNPTNDSIIYSHIFNILGFYNYDCSVSNHAQLGMIGTITVDVFGCMDVNACNYDVNATFDDGSCVYNSFSYTSLNACDTLVWNNNFYSQSGVYFITLINSNGCDSIATLDLTILNSSSSIDSVVACDNFTWINGINYNQSNFNDSDTLINSDGCDSIVFLFLEILPIPQFSYQQNNVLCNGQSNASIDLTISSLNIESIIWSNGETSEDIDSLSSGTYSVLITDSNSCSSNTSFTVTEPDLLITSIFYNDLLCFNDSSGYIDLTVTGGSSNYNYLWSNGSTNEDLNNLSSGYYYVNILDDNNCFVFDSITISQPNVLSFNSSENNVLCYGDSSGSILINVSGGSFPYDYFINGQFNTSGSFFNNLIANNYFILVKDSNNCLSSNVISISEPTELTSTFDFFSNILCFGDNTGYIDFSVNGGVSPYSFLWNNGSQNEDLSGLYADSYYVLVTDSNNCSLTDSISLTQNDLIETFITDSICSGDIFSVGSVSYNTSGNYINTLLASNGCDSVVNLNLLVFDELYSGSISDNQFLCFGDVPNVHFFDSTPSGADGSFSYLWQYSTNNGLTFDNASGVNNDTIYFPNSLNISTKFRVKILSNFGCGIVYTNTIKDSVYNDLTPAIISNDQTICYNSQPNLISISTFSTGGGSISNSSYTWEYSDDGITSWQSINNGVSFQPNSLFNTRFYRVKTVSDFNCGPVYSNVIVITVLDSLLPGSINSSQNICFNTAPNELFFNNLPSGADSNYSYIWQKSQNNLSWDNLFMSDSIIYQPEVLDNSTFYRSIVISDFGCGSSLTNSVFISVYDEFLNGQISTNDTICYNTNANDILTTISPLGGNTPYSYEWSLFDSISSTWIVQSSGFNNNFSPGTLTSSSYFRVKFISNSGCGEYFSNSSYVHVLPKVSSPMIASNQTICFDSLASELEMIIPPSGGNDFFEYSWQSSIDSINWSLANGIFNDTVYFPGNMSNSTYYRLEVQSSDSSNCISRYSDTILIDVLDPLSAGQISSNQSICFNSIPDSLFFILDPSGVDNSFIFQWQESFDNINWLNISGALSSKYQPNQLTESKYFRVRVSSNFGCGVKFTSSVYILVYSDFNPGTISDNDTICLGDDINLIELSSSSFGSNGIYSYQWQFNDNGFWDNLMSANDTFYQPTNLSDTTTFRLNVISLCGNLNTNNITVVVNPLPEAYNILGEFSVCNNQNYSNYSLETTPENYRYFWYTNGGDIVGTNESKNCLINWSSNIGQYNLFVDVYVYETGCSITSFEDIFVNSESSPNICSIILKDNSNILVASDSSQNIRYQWGYDNKQTNETFIFENDTLRYIQLSNSIDTLQFRYWVDTYFDYNNISCYTRSYFNSSPFPLSINDFLSDFIIYPNPVNDVLFYTKSFNPSSINIFDFYGRKINSDINFINKSVDISKNDSGIYFIVFYIEDFVVTKKIILE